MITFLDEQDVEYGAQVELKVTNGINGEKSISGTIHSNDDVLNNIDKGWRLRFNNEYYVIIYSQPVDLGNVIEVEFDAVHQFFYDFKKSIVHQELNGSNTFAAYIRFIFQDSGYEYRIEGQVNAIEKQSFGFKDRLTLFNDIIKSSGAEFQVNGRVVRIMPKVGTDLSTIVKKNFNLNELKIEKNINDFVTYKKGYGAWFDEEDHSKGRLEVEYASPLMSIYGKIEGEPIIDERYTNAESLKKKLKDEVENSYSISVSMDFEDLTKAGYQYEQPVAGDYIMAINDDVQFREKIRIVSFESHYDVAGNLINHKVTCNDIGSVKKREADYAHMSKTIESQQETQNKALEIANLALVSANGKNKNYYGTEMPVDKPKGTLIVGDTLFLRVGDRVKRYYWNGSDWIVDPFDEDINYVKNQLTEVFNQFSTERTETEQAINEALDSAKAEAERLDNERQTIIDGKFEVVNKANEKLEQSIATAEQNAQDALTKAGASEDLAKTAKEISENALANIGTVSTELAEVKTQASDSLIKAQEALNATGTLSTQVQSYEETVDGYKSEVANYSRTNETLTAKVKSYEETVDGYSQSLTRVEGKIDSGVGGWNLLQKGNVPVSNSYYHMKSYVLDSIPVEGEYYTCVLKGQLGNGKTRFRLLNTNDRVHLSDMTDLQNGLYSATFKWNNKIGSIPISVPETVRVYVVPSDNIVESKIEWITLVKGQIGTSEWIPALSEVTSQSDFKSYQNQVNSTTEEHTRRLTALDGDGGRISKVEQKADRIETSLSDYAKMGYVDTKVTQSAGTITTQLTNLKGDFDNLKIGVRNYVVMSKLDSYAPYNTTPEVVSDKSFKTTVVNSSENRYIAIRIKDYVPSNDVYTISGFIRVNGEIPKSSPFTMKVMSRNSEQIDSSAIHYNTNNGYFYSTEKYRGNNSWLIDTLTNLAKDDVITFHMLKFERGQKPTDWTPAPEDMATQTEFQTVKETTQLYERTIGSTEESIKSNIAKITMTDSLFQAEVSKNTDLKNTKSKVTQLSNSWALTLKSGNDIKTAINATTDGIRLKGSLITLDGQVNMTSSFIVPEGNIGNLSAKKITSGTIDTARLNSADIVTKGLTSNVVKSEHILANEALFTKLFTNDLATQKLATKQAWIKSSMIGDAQIGTAQIGQIDASNGRIVNLDASSITSGTMTANRISGGTLTSTNGATSFNLNTGQLSFLQQGVAIKNQFSGRPLQYLGFYSGTIHGSQGSYTALMSNSGNVVAMDENSTGIQIWNSFDKKTAVNLYGNNITFMRHAKDTNSIDIDTINRAITNVNTINELRIVPMAMGSTPGVALMYGDSAGMWIGGYGDFAFKHGGNWIGKANIIN